MLVYLCLPKVVASAYNKKSVKCSSVMTILRVNEFQPAFICIGHEINIGLILRTRSAAAEQMGW